MNLSNLSETVDMRHVSPNPTYQSDTAKPIMGTLSGGTSPLSVADTRRCQALALRR